MRKIIFLTLLTASASILQAQIYLADNGLTVTGTGNQKKVSLGSTTVMANSQTLFDFGTNVSTSVLFRKGATNYFFIGNNGSIGINTITPLSTVKLDVNGTIRATALLFPTSAAAGKILSSDASGNANWTSYTAGYIKSNGTLFTSSPTIAGSDVSGNISGNAANVTGTITIANGGTGGTTQNVALNNLLPSQASNAGKVLQTNGTDASWVAAAGGSSPWTTSGSNINNSNSGNVGIGAANPATKLHVVGDIRADGGILNFVNNCTSCSSLIPTASFGTTAINGLQIRAKTGSSTDFGFFDPSGNTYLLAYTGSNSLYFGDDAVLNPTKKLYLDGKSDTYISEVTGNTIGFITGGSERLRIDASGNLGIGITTVPVGYKLAVAGNIITEKVRVKLQSAGWPDYVFHSGYQLPSIKEVEQFIKENKHLPGVLSAQEVGKNGLDLGDNQAIMLKKIEELTLYIIELNKKSEKQDKELKDLRKEFEELRKAISN